jgi:hypothetical protein
MRDMVRDEMMIVMAEALRLLLHKETAHLVDKVECDARLTRCIKAAREGDGA